MAKRKARGLGRIDAKYPVSKTRSCKITPDGPGNNRVSMSQVEQCANMCSSHWFDKESMRFFGTRLDHVAYVDGKGAAYFVTSEKRPRSTDPRAYSVRRYDGKCGIDTVGQFQGYKTKAAAKKAADAAASGGAHYVKRTFAGSKRR